jgi:GNAT superfamily N-acetyltransferase
MADQNPFSEFGGELKAKVSSDNPFSEFGGELKKKEPTSLGFSVTPLPSQDKFQQGLKFAQQGFKMPSADVQRQKKEQGYLLNTVSSLDRGFYKNLVGNPVKGLGTLLQGTTAKVLGGSGKGFVSEALIDFGDYFNKTIDELAPQDEEFKNSLTDQFAQAFGQVGSLVLTAGAGGGGKGASMATQLAPKAAGKAAAARGLAAELTSPTSISAGLSMGQAEFEKAKQFGASDEDAFEVFYKNAAVGSVLEKIPTMQFLKRFNQATSGGIANYIKTKGVAGITGGLEEMTTEVLQQIYANKTAKDVYNINQNIFEDLTSSGGIGFGVGFLLNAMGAKARLLKRDGKTSEAKQIQDQIQQFESKIEDDNKKGQDEKIKVNNIVDKIEKGELVPLEDIEFYEANKNKIDKAIQAKQLEAELSAPSVIMPEENVAPEIIEPTRPAVIMPEENVPVETTVVRPEQQGKAPSVIMPEANVAPEVAETVVTEEVKPTEVKPTEEANYNVIAADYLFTGGKGVILSTDYFLQALTASFPYSSEKINEIRNRYANKFGNIKDDIGTDSYNSAINEIKDEINKTYNNEKASELFDKIVNNSTGFTLSREGNKVSSELEKLNEEFKPTETKAEVKPTEVKPEVKSKLEAFKSKFAPQPKQLSLKGIGAAETRKINEEAKKVEPKDARGFALSWLATGDESVSPDSLNKLLGSFRASLNVGKVKKTQEERLRDYVDKEGEDIDKVADKIWDRLPEQMQDKFTSMDVRDQLEMLIAEYPTRKDAAAALVEYGTGEQGVEEQQARYEEGKGVSETQEEAPIEIKGGFVPIEEDIDAKSLSKNIEDKYNVKLDLFETDKDISLSKIVVPKETRGKGIGTSAMEEIINYADINNKRILLTPSTDFGGTSVDRLKEFYKGFGFVENKGKNKDFTTKETMYRNPIQVEETPFAIEEVTSEEVNQMQDIVKDYINEGITSLPEIKKAIAKELGYNTRKLRQTIDDAYNKYTATKEAAPVEVTSGVVGRIGNALKKMFGKDAQKPFVAKDSKALEAKLSDIKDDVRFQIEAGFRGANDMPVAYRYDTDQVARERFDIPKLKKIGEGSDRVVFDLKDGKVLKIAKTPRGLEQNIYEGDYYLSGTILPETFERGLNYVVVEKISPAITRTIDLGIADINIESDKKGIGKLNDLLKKLKQFTQKDFDNHNGDLQDILAEYDLTDIMNYDVIWNDFTAKRNWGLKDGEPLHLDGGTFGGIQMLDRFKGQKPLSDPEFRDIYNKSKKAKIENKDVDKFTKFMAEPNADLSRGIEKQKIIDKAKQDGTFMKAPNGKKSNLNEEQWVSVRTKEFKNWFGDWESNPKDASKVVDKNGEPRVIYHGTNANFDKFDKEKLGSKNWMADSAYTGFFFAGDKKTSQAYVGINNADWMGLSMAQSPILTSVVNKYKTELEAAEKSVENVSQSEIEKARKKHEKSIAPLVDKLREIKTPESFIKEFAEFKRIPTEVFKDIDRINTENGNNKRLNDVKDKIFKEVEKGWFNEKGLEPIILNLFLNVRNPLVFDFENNEDTEGLAEKIKAAKLLGNDGVIFNNLADGADVDDIFVAFEPNQIKSAEKNTGAYAVDDERINFMSDNGILGFTYKNKMYLNGEKLNPNTPIHEAGHIWVEWTKTNDPKIYAKGMELVEGSPYLAKVKESKFYQQQTENMNDAEKAEYFKNEALAMAIGDKGAQFVVESKKESFKDWLKTLWTKIKSLTGFKDLTEEEFQNLTFEEFSKMAVKEILGVENDLDQFQAARSMKKKKEFVKGKVRGEANKRAIDDFEVDDMVKLIKADYDLQTLKNIKDAIQKRSAEEVLPSQPRKIGERRGERKRVEPRVEGDEAAGEGEATPTEDVEKEWQGAITIAANEERRQMLGLPEYQREKQSFEEWTNKAIKMIKRGYNVEKLLDKMEKGNYSPTPEENQIRKIYVAKLKSDYDANPTPELEKKLIRYAQLNDIVNSQLGRQLRSLADVTEPRETLADFVISKMEANNVDELTEKQRKQVEKQYEEIKKKEEDVEAKLEINDELNAQLLAETVFKEEKAKRKPYQKTKDYKADRKSIIESIKQKWKDKDKPTDVLMALPFPVPTKKAQQLVAIAPDVSKLMASYIEEGVDDLKEIVSRIYVDLRNEIDGLSEKDIFDVIAGRYKKEKPLLTQLQLKKAELKKEAELIAKIEDIMAGNMPTNEKAKIEQNQRITQLRNELRDLKKEVGFYDLSKINSLKEKNLEKIKEIDEKIQKGDFEKAIKAPSFLENPEFRKKYPKEYEAYIQSAKELSDKKHEFEVSLAKDELKGLTFRDKLVKRWGPEFKNTLSAIKATLDNSFIFIQLGPAIWSNPLLLPKVLNEQRKVIFNEGRFKREIVQIFENKELANLIEVSGLDILDPQTLRESLREEQLGGTDFLERSVEIKGKKYSLATIIKAPFERIAIAAGNYVRLKLFLESVSHLEAQGKTIETHEKEFKDAARIANEMTARGELAEEFKTGKLKTLSSLTWAPKMIGSTINLLGLGDIYNYALGRKGYYASLSPELRKAAIGKMATAITVPYLIMAAIALDDDFEVDYDPRSVTFGQLKQLSTGESWNPYGRFTSVVRYLILMMLGVRYIGDEKLRADFKTETFKFFRGKMAPAYGLGLDLAFREGFDGQPLSFNDVAKDAITPLAIKDLKSYMEDDGTWGLITKGLPAISGIKVGTEKQFNQAKQPLEDVIKKHARTDATYYSFELKNPSTKEIATKEQFNKFVKERDRLIAEKLTDLYNGYVITDSPNPVPFVSLEANEAGKQISTAKSEATKEAKEIVFGKKKKTAMERLIERKRRLLRR